MRMGWLSGWIKWPSGNTSVSAWVGGAMLIADHPTCSGVKGGS